MAKQGGEVLQARTSFVTDVAGRRRRVRSGELVAGDDPRVKGNEGRFRAVSEAVEQASAAPGERRSVPTKPRTEPSAETSAKTTTAKTTTAKTKTEPKADQPDPESERADGDGEG